MLVPPAREPSLLPDRGLLDATFGQLDEGRVSGSTKALDALTEWIDAASRTGTDGSDAPGSGVALVGDTGTGKTHMLTAAATELSEQLPSETVASGYRVLLIGEAQLHAYLRQCWSNGDSATRLCRAIAGENRSWLFLDDLGVAASDERFAKEVADLLLRRHASRYRTLTVVSTNLTLTKIERIFGARLASRLYEMLLVYPLEGDDQRRPGN